MIKRFIKAGLTRFSFSNRVYEDTRHQYHHYRKLAFHLLDAKETSRDMGWDKNTTATYWAKSSELIFQYHKLEKGLCLPGPRRSFGLDPAAATLSLLGEWRTLGFATNDPIYQGAIETLRAYRKRIDEMASDDTAKLRKKLDEEIERHPENYPELQTPCPTNPVARDDVFNALKTLAKDRRSVRSFTSQNVDPELVRQAIAIAQLSPSACNRQPCRIHLYEQRELIDAMLELQNGNRGFGHTIQTLLVLTADASSFFDATERHEPYIDGGLFAMSLLLALQAQGISSCCLNWCVEPAQDKAAHQRGDIPTNERIIMYIAIGYAPEGTLVPRSPRRDIAQTILSHGSKGQELR